MGIVYMEKHCMKSPREVSVPYGHLFVLFRTIHFKSIAKVSVPDKIE